MLKNEDIIVIEEEINSLLNELKKLKNATTVIETAKITALKSEEISKEIIKNNSALLQKANDIVKQIDNINLENRIKNLENNLNSIKKDNESFRNNVEKLEISNKFESIICMSKSQIGREEEILKHNELLSVKINNVEKTTYKIEEKIEQLDSEYKNRYEIIENYLEKLKTEVRINLIGIAIIIMVIFFSLNK